MRSPNPRHEIVFLVYRDGAYTTTPHRPTDVHGMALRADEAREFIAWWEAQRQARVDVVRALCGGL